MALGRKIIQMFETLYAPDKIEVDEEEQKVNEDFEDKSESSDEQEELNKLNDPNSPIKLSNEDQSEGFML